MAQEMEIRGSQYAGKIRNPVGVIALSMVTLGIYGAVWYFKANKELAEIGKANGTEECGTHPGLSLLAVTLGAFLVVPALMSGFGFCKRVAAAEQLTGAARSMEPGMLFVLYLFIAPVAIYMIQTSMNRVLGMQAGVVGGADLGAAMMPGMAGAPAAAPKK